MSLRAALVCMLMLHAWALPQDAGADTRLFTFSWPFTDSDEMRPRGGTTAGTPVTLAGTPTEAWLALREEGLAERERDRRAILAMAGAYQVSFDFIETVGFTADYSPPRPYQSWATEYVYTDEDRGDFIALQHILVMFFEDEDGEVHGPIVQKHWRQEWRYEKRDLHVYAGHNRWERERFPEDEVRGLWAQAVSDVDDSPRYEALGKWTHEANYSAWTSAPTWRPLPQRESSVRSDYHVLAGINRHTITPDGWVHEQDNLKLVLDRNGEAADGQAYLARELGVNRYRQIVGFDFSAGDRYRERTDAFWADVRAGWADVLARRDRFELAAQRDGRRLFEHMFDYAERLNRGAPYEPDDSRELVRRTLDAYLD